MTLRIRPAHLDADRELLLGLFRACLPRVTDATTFDWLYRKNPHGLPLVWLALSDERVVGATSAFARRFLVRGRVVRAWVLGDFCVVPEHRSLGPALALQRACLDALEHDGPTLWYDFPSAAMLAVYRRLGRQPSCHMVRFVRLLRADPTIFSFVKNPILTRGISAPLNLALSLRSRLSRRDPSLTLSLHDGPCGEEFSSLAREASHQLGVSVDRSADYLNWRYRENPLCRHEVLTARRAGELVAYAVFVDDGREGLLVDLFGTNETSVLGALLEALSHLLRGRGRRAISAPMIASHPWLATLRAHAFAARESQPLMIRGSCQAGTVDIDGHNHQLVLTYGDRDS